MKNSKQEQKNEKNTASNKILTVVGIILCIILVPILVVNVTMIIKGLVNKDKVPTVGGFAPMIVLTDSMNPPTSDEYAPMYPIDMTFKDTATSGTRAEVKELFINRVDTKRTLELSIDGEKTTFKKIMSGDLIIIKTAKAEDIKVGDVISFLDPKSGSSAVVTHRVIALEYNEATGELINFRTRGDNNNAADPDPVPVENLVGKWTGKTFGALGNIAIFLQSTPGLILCIAVPIVLLVGYEIIRRRKTDTAKKKDTDALLKELEELRALKEKAAGQKAEGEVTADVAKPEGPGNNAD
ncbi:MAG: signal peptidase I [Clostridia bacterium]|nr:signal peptidase I [Clostridia bacterium]